MTDLRTSLDSRICPGCGTIQTDPAATECEWTGCGALTGPYHGNYECQGGFPTIAEILDGGLGNDWNQVNLGRLGARIAEAVGAEREDEIARLRAGLREALDWVAIPIDLPPGQVCCICGSLPHADGCRLVRLHKIAGGDDE